MEKILLNKEHHIYMSHMFFSFDEVREYLEQHLRIILQSKILDGTDKTELYALYINCFEVRTLIKKYILKSPDLMHTFTPQHH